MSTSLGTRYLWWWFPSHLFRLPAFDDGVGVRYHLAVPIPVATHLPAHCFCTAASPAGCSCAIPDGDPAQRWSSAILPPSSTWGTELNKALMHFLCEHASRTKASKNMSPELLARQFALCFQPSELRWCSCFSWIQSCTQDNFMMHSYLTEKSLKLRRLRKKAVKRQLGGDERKYSEHETRIKELAE